MNQFANVNIDRVFDVLGIQLKAKRPTVSILEKAGAPELSDIHVLDNLYITMDIKSREYSGKYYSTTFKEAAVKTYLALYFYAHSDGTTSNIPYDELCEYIGIHKKTLRSSLKKLEEKGYITCYPERYTFFAEISNYNEMYVSENHSFNIGYITLNQQLLKDVIKVKGINGLRCVLLAIFRILRNQFKSSTKLPAAMIKLQDFRYNMPTYVKPCVIMKALKETEGFFGMFKQQYDNIILVLDKKYQASTIKRELRKAGKIKINNFLQEFDELQEEATEEYRAYKDLDIDTLVKGAKLGLNPDDMLMTLEEKGSLPKLNFTAKIKDNLHNLCTEFNIDNVITAIRIFYEKYKLQNIYIENVGGLIRSILQDINTYYGPEFERVALS